MLLFNSTLFKPALSFLKLADCMKHLPLIAKWAEEEWGYIRNKGTGYREEVFESLKNNIFIGFFANQPVAMFAIFPHEHLNETEELMYVYVDKNYRGLRLSHQIIEQAKSIAKNHGNSIIILDTLKPSLNSLYKKHGAKVICENSLFSHPTETLKITL